MTADATNTDAPPLSAGRLRSLQIGRGLAAMLVVLFHLNNSVWGIDKYFPHPFSPLLSFGNAGVQFFFVLSGFIIFLVHGRDIGAAGQLRAFAIKRFIRIYPTYWIVLAVFILTLVAEPFLGTADERRLGNFIASVLLIPASVEPILSVAWTLKHEVMFYVVFAVAIWRATTGLWVFAIWQAACVGNMLVGSDTFPYDILLSPNNLLFSFGLIAAHLFKAQRCPAPGVVAIAGAALFILTGCYQVMASVTLPADVAVLAFGLSSAIAILGACTYERRQGLRPHRLLEAIGDASYAIYLVHLPLLSLFAKVLFSSGLAAHLLESLSFVLVFAAVIVVGVLFSRLVEMPLVAALSRSVRRVAQPHRTAPVP